MQTFSKQASSQISEKELISKGHTYLSGEEIKQKLIGKTFWGDVPCGRKYISYCDPNGSMEGENDTLLKIYLEKGSIVQVNTETGKGHAELLQKRPIFYEVNYLHYNPNIWWTWFSDIFSAALIFFALSSIFMVKGKKGAWGRGGIYITFGIILPIVFLIIFK